MNKSWQRANGGSIDAWLLFDGNHNEYGFYLGRGFKKGLAAGGGAYFKPSFMGKNSCSE